MGLKDISWGSFSHLGCLRMVQISGTKSSGESSNGVGKKLGLDENLGKWGEAN